MCHGDQTRRAPEAWQRDANAATDSAKLRYVRRFNERVGAPELCRDQDFVSKFSDIQTRWTLWRICPLSWSNASVIDDE